MEKNAQNSKIPREGERATAAAAAAATEKEKAAGTHAVHKFVRLWRKKNSCEVADEADNAVEAEIHTHTRTVEDTNKQKAGPGQQQATTKREANFTR